MLPPCTTQSPHDLSEAETSGKSPILGADPQVQGHEGTRCIVEGRVGCVTSTYRLSANYHLTQKQHTRITPTLETHFSARPSGATCQASKVLSASFGCLARSRGTADPKGRKERVRIKRNISVSQTVQLSLNP